MINRREFFPLASATAAAGLGAATLATTVNASVSGSESASSSGVRIDPSHLSSPELARHSIRLPKLDQQSTQDFFTSVRMAMRTTAPDLGDQLEALAASQGVRSSELSLEAAWQLAMRHPTYASRTRLNTSAQQLMWSGIAAVFHNEADSYLRILEATDSSGPGSLELNPAMPLPDYTRHEIHIQPGGYVGDEFAGAIALYGFKQFDRQFSFNDHQEHHLAMAQEMPQPLDGGEVRRVLDLGCGTGGLATALKERFPEAEVWGIDVGGPMVRWAHYRAVKMGIPVRFAQRLGEDSKFDSDSFDMVGSYIMFHEVSAEAAKKIVAEIYRILRPGGVFKPVDFGTRGNPFYKPPATVVAKAGTWSDHRYNNERWSLEYRDTDFPALLRSVGFEVTIGPQIQAFGDLTARKPA